MYVRTYFSNIGSGLVEFCVGLENQRSYGEPHAQCRQQCGGMYGIVNL
jgi:hypothetical protein